MQNKPLNEKLASKAQEAVSVALLRYNKLSSRIGNKEIVVVEGADDATFYSAVFSRKSASSARYFFIANGKDNVLKLRDLIAASKDIPRAGGVVFLVDRDFDGLKGYAASENTYITPFYSIENILICRSGFLNFLLADFKMSEADAIPDVDKALALFDQLLAQHAVALAEANRLIHHVRQESLKGRQCASRSIDSRPGKFADLDPKSLNVIQISTGDELGRLVGLDRSLSEQDLITHSAAFEAIVPATGWRGKFLFHLYRRFLSFLCEDRNKKTPLFFSKGGGRVSISLDPDSLVRTLASACLLPDCLSRFVEEIGVRKLQ